MMMLRYELSFIRFFADTQIILLNHYVRHVCKCSIRYFLFFSFSKSEKAVLNASPAPIPPPINVNANRGERPPNNYEND